MRSKFIAFLVLVSLALHLPLKAQEGMWIPALLKSLNESEMQANGLKLNAEDIYSINQSSLKDAVVHFGGGCTGEVVSDKGLILTNHHCGYGQIQSHSSEEHNYLKDGFWASNYGEELPNPGLSVTFIVRMEDVTNQVLKGVTGNMEEAKRDAQVGQNSRAVIEKAIKGTHYKAQVRPFFNGNNYYMFVTETFNDVRLVGAPPSSIGKFGYDKDNWVWPRHTGDFSVFRIYADANNKPAEYSKDNKPYKPKHHFPISLNGIKENDFTMIYGFPGRTEQYLTSYAVDYVVNKSNPAKIKMRKTSLSIIDRDMASSERIDIAYAAKQSRISNAYKKWIGQNIGLKNIDAVKIKQEREAEFMKLVASKGAKEFDGLLPQFKKLYENREKYELAFDYFLELYYYGPEVIRFAERFSNLAENYEQLAADGKLDAAITEVKKGVDGYFKNYNMPTDKAIFQALTALYYQGVDPALRPSIFDEEVMGSHKGSFEAYTNEVYETSMLVSKAQVEDLLNNFSKKKVKALRKDPAYLLWKSLMSTYQAEVRIPRNTINNEISRLMRTYVKGITTLVPDKRFWSDANSTLRVAYGKVTGSSPRDGMSYKYYTTTEGILQKYIPNDRDYHVDYNLLKLANNKDFGRYANEKGEMQVCFTASNHTTGGNSGSPALNGYGHLIGINFDRSWESTMSDIMYDPEVCRNIMVDIRYVLFIIDKYAGAKHLVDEMTLVDYDVEAKMQEDKIEAKINDITDMMRSDNGAEPFYKRALALRELGNYEKAMGDVNEAIKIDAKYAAAYALRGELKTKAGDVAGGKKDLVKAKKLGYK